MGACHVDLGAAYLGAFPGMGAYHSTGQNSYLGAYAGDYGKYGMTSFTDLFFCYRLSTTSY